ncbi:MAG: O-antigen ligase family protein [Eubacteriaceae bacterium]|nr:O-antigen ligase family protein [Eubacteriaceae bacterium]
MEVIQKGYAIIINLISNVTSRISEGARYNIMFVSCFLITGICVFNSCYDFFGISVSKSTLTNLSCLLMLVILLMSIDRKVAPVQVNTAFWTAWIICFGMIFLTSFMHPVNHHYFMWSVVCLFGCPAFYLIWQNRQDYDYIFEIVSICAVIMSYVFFFANLFCIPFINDSLNVRFVGIASNPNGVGLICVGFFAAALYMSLTGKGGRIFFMISAGISVGLTILSQSRTAELAIAMELLVGVIYYLKNYTDINWKKAVTRVVMTLVVLSVTTAAVYSGITAMGKLDLNTYAATEVQQGIDTAGDRFNNYNKDLNTFSSGRIEIWKMYAKEFTFFGKEKPGKGIDSKVPQTRWAHNNYIDISYSSGIFAGLGYLIWLLISLGFVIKGVFGRRGKDLSFMFVVMAISGYFVEAMLEILMFPATTHLAFILFISLMPVAAGNVKNARNIR